MRIKYEDLVTKLENVLLNHGANSIDAKETASMFAQNSLDGIYSHGANRFPVFINQVKKGQVKVDQKATKVIGFNGFERWDGNLGIGIINAKKAMNRAVELADEFGIGIIALGNTNHWMRGGAYGWQAADLGKIGICWTNTFPNMPAWGGVEPKIGNNPLVIAIPKSDGRHVVLDMAMSQFAFGKIEDMRMKGEQLPVHGGFDLDGNLTTDPAKIEESGRALPTGYWKGSGLSILMDLVAAVLSKGNTVQNVGELGDEYGLSQIFIAINPTLANTFANIDEVLEETIENIKVSTPIKAGDKIFYPGEIEYNTRAKNLEEGIPILQEVLDKIDNL